MDSSRTSAHSRGPNETLPAQNTAQAASVNPRQGPAQENVNREPGSRNHAYEPAGGPVPVFESYASPQFPGAVPNPYPNPYQQYMLPKPAATAPNPYQPYTHEPEPLFVPVNPYDAPPRRWRRPARPAQQQYPGLDATSDPITVAPGTSLPMNGAPPAGYAQPVIIPSAPAGQFAPYPLPGWRQTPAGYVPEEGPPLFQGVPILPPFPAGPAYYRPSPPMMPPIVRDSRSPRRRRSSRSPPRAEWYIPRPNTPVAGREYAAPSPTSPALPPANLFTPIIHQGRRSSRSPPGIQWYRPAPNRYNTSQPAPSPDLPSRRHHSRSRSHERRRSRSPSWDSFRGRSPPFVQAARPSRMYRRSPTRVVAVARPSRSRSRSPPRIVSRSRSRSPRIVRRSRSRSPPVIVRRSRSRSPDIVRRSRSRSPRIVRRSRSRSPPVIVRRSRSRSPPVIVRRSRSRSPPVIVRRSRSRSPVIVRRARSRSPRSVRRSRSRSPPHIIGRSRSCRSRSRSPRIIRRSRSRSPPHIVWRSRSRSPRVVRRSRSRSRSPVIVHPAPVIAPPSRRSHSRSRPRSWYSPRRRSRSSRRSSQVYASDSNHTYKTPSRPLPRIYHPHIEVPDAFPRPHIVPWSTSSAPHMVDSAQYSLASGLPLPATSSSSTSSLYTTFQTAMLIAFFFLFETIPRQLYLHFLLRIPSLYFTRVSRIFEDARLSLPDIKRMARARAEQWNPAENPAWPAQFLSIQPPDQTAPLPRSLLVFRSTWENFIDSLMREWKTLNIISVLLMSAILTMLQIDAAGHPITRTSALFSLICSLMSLLYGCMYIIRFGTMRKMHKASSFATEAQKGSTSIWWNVWVLLAMPAIWLSWSIILFFVTIMSFVWLSGSSQDATDFIVSPRAALGPRIGLTVVFSLGVIYFVLIVRTFHRYGDPLDREWMRMVNQWTNEAATSYYPIPPIPPPGTGPNFDLKVRPVSPRSSIRRSTTPYRQAGAPVEVPSSWMAAAGFTRLQPSIPATTRPSAFFETPAAAALAPVDPLTIMQLGSDVLARARAYTNPTWAHAINSDDWSRFMLDVSSAWNGQLSLTRREAADSSTTDLPVYTLLPPARPNNPIPTSAESGEFVINAARSKSVARSESSYGSVQLSRYVEPEASPAALAPDNSSTEEQGQTTSALFQDPSSSSPRSPVDGPEPSPSTSHAHAPAHPEQTVREFIDLWNERYFHPRNIEASLVPLHDPSSPEFAVNLALRPAVPSPDVASASLDTDNSSFGESDAGPPRSFATAEDPSLSDVPSAS